MTVAMAPSPYPAKPTMTQESREVLTRLIEYALGEANREGETSCACHLYQALDALTPKPAAADCDWADEISAETHLLS